MNRPTESRSNTTQPAINSLKGEGPMNRKPSRVALLVAAASLALLLAPAVARADGADEVVQAVAAENVTIMATQIEASMTDKPAEGPAPEVLVVEEHSWSSPDAPDGSASTDAALPDPGASPDRNEYDVRYNTISPAWKVDYWNLYADGGESLTVTMERTSGNLDPFLELYDPYGRLIAWDDDSAGNLNARIDTVLPGIRGLYRVAARSYGYSSAGGYRITQDQRDRCQPSYGSVTAQSTWVTDDWGNRRSLASFGYYQPATVNVTVRNSGSRTIPVQLNYQTVRLSSWNQWWGTNFSATANIRPGTWTLGVRVQAGQLQGIEDVYRVEVVRGSVVSAVEGR